MYIFIHIYMYMNVYNFHILMSAHTYISQWGKMWGEEGFFRMAVKFLKSPHATKLSIQ